MNRNFTLYLALQSTGLVELSFNPRLPVHESISIANIHDAGIMPGWIALHSDKIFTISRTDSRNTSGEISIFSSSDLALLDRFSSEGNGGVHMEVSHSILAAANIEESTLLFRTPTAERIVRYGDEADPHQVAFHGENIYVPLRSADRIDVYSKTTFKVIRSFGLPNNTGPRHVAFHPTLPFFYLASERDNTLRVFHITEGEQQKWPVDGPLAGEIAVSADGAFVYVSNRGVDPSRNDTLAVFALDHVSGQATFVTTQSVAGLHPRMFSLYDDIDGKAWVAVANQLSQTVSVFERNAGTGLLGELRGLLRVSREALAGQPEKELSEEVLRRNQKEGPMCVQWKVQKRDG